MRRSWGTDLRLCFVLKVTAESGHAVFRSVTPCVHAQRSRLGQLQIKTTAIGQDRPASTRHQQEPQVRKTLTENRGKIPEKMQNSTLTWMAVNGPYLEKLSMCKRNKQQWVEIAFLLSGCVIFARWKWMQLSGMEEILATSGDIVGRKETGLRIDLVQFHIARFSVVVFKTAETDSREKILPSNLWTQDTRRKTDAWNLCVCVPI